MIRRKKICKTCGTPQYIFSHGDCQRCWAIASTKKKNEEMSEIRNKDNRFYSEIWAARPHVCTECGKTLPALRKLFVHHLLLKSTYPQFRHEPENVVLICADCHSQVHSNIEKTPKIKQLTEEIKAKLL